MLIKVHKVTRCSFILGEKFTGLLGFFCHLIKCEKIEEAISLY